MKTYTFSSWVVENGTPVHKEFTFEAPNWSAARRMMSEALRAYS